MKIRRLFPLGKAYGATFCNRIDETKRLTSYIENGTHTYLVAPRRYGKSSLCENVFNHSKLPCVKLDFHLAINEKNAEHIIINGVTELIGKAIGAIDKLQHIVKKYVTKLKPKISLTADYMKLEFAFDENNSNPAEDIAEALLLLEKLLQERNKQAVLLLDEFQEIGRMNNGHGIEGAIRHAAQETQNLAIVFSGSNPHMLSAMFEDERRPLYKLCRKLLLDRISEKDYKPHLDKAARYKWNKALPKNVFEQIMQLTERHPYYINYLCDELWLNAELPALDVVTEAWDRIVEEERSDLLKDFFSLPDNQRKLMIYIANFGGNNLYASDVAIKTEIPSGSITTALSTLVEKNYIEKIERNYRIIVPLYKKLLKAR